MLKAVFVSCFDWESQLIILSNSYIQCMQEYSANFMRDEISNLNSIV